MSSIQESKLIKDQGEEVLFEAVLNALAKALKAMNFYPQDHPLREESIISAMAQLKPLLKEKELILLWGRDACTVADRAALRSNSATAKSLGREMLIRKLQRLIILPELSIRDLKAFLNIFTADPAEVLSKGGIEKAMMSAGICTLGANEVDLAILRNIQGEIAEEDNENPSSPEEDDSSSSQSSSVQAFQMDDPLGLKALLEKLKNEKDEAGYRQILRGVIDVSDKLIKKGSFEPLLEALPILLELYYSDERGVSEKEYTKYALEQIADGGMMTSLLDQIETRNADTDLILDGLCKTIGKALAYPLIQRLCIAESLHTRKIIANYLTKTGEAGIPAIVSMLKDERWYVVRNMVTILGEIASRDALKPLQGAIGHSEAKVRKEIIKALIKISPQEAESSVISFLKDSDREVVRQAIHSLGTMRSRLAVLPLLEIISDTDIFLKDLELKKQAVSAIGRIGDRQATATLMDILAVRGWLAPRSWLELKIAVANALGLIGDESALPLLKHLAKANTLLGKACAEAADNLERVAK